MDRKKGFTLVEVIVAIAILGIISVSFLTAISSHFSFLNKTKAISQSAFLAQRDMEEKIDITVDKIRKNELTLKEKSIFNSLKSGGIKVKYYELKTTNSNKNYHTLVSNIKPEILEAIPLASIGIKLKQGTVENLYGYGTGGFSLIGKFKNHDNYKWDHLLNVVEWYVSTEDYNMPIPQSSGFNIDDDTIHNSYYYPLFPRDYILVSNEIVNSFGSHERTFPKLSSYAGRHIVFTATPGAKSGKIGIQKVSEPIFISGLPIINNLAIHLDASFINSYDSNEVEKTVNTIKVKKWLDLSSIVGKTNPIESASFINGKPELLKTDMGVGFIGQYVDFGLNQSLTITSQGTNNKSIYIFAVARNKVDDESVYMKNGTSSFTLPTGNMEDWLLLDGIFNSKDNDFEIGGPNVDIAEILIYNSVLTEDEIITIKEYLNSKYKL